MTLDTEETKNLQENKPETLFRAVYAGQNCADEKQGSSFMVKLMMELCETVPTATQKSTCAGSTASILLFPQIKLYMLLSS